MRRYNRQHSIPRPSLQSAVRFSGFQMGKPVYIADTDMRLQFFAWMQKVPCAFKSGRQVLNHVRAREIRRKGVRFQAEKVDLPSLLQTG